MQNIEHEPVIHRAHEILKVYKETDPEVPLGGLPVRDYEVIRRAIAEVPDPAPDLLHDAAWIDIEYLMAAARGATNPDTEEPFSSKEINAIMESARNRLRAILKNEHTPPALRAEAKVLLAGVPIHEEVARGRRDGLVGKFHVPFLLAIQEASLELLAVATPEDDHTLHRMLLLITMADNGYKAGWALPAAPRQPWDITRHSLKRYLPDLPIIIDGEDTETVVGMPSSRFGDDLWPNAGPHASLRHYAQFPVQIKYNSSTVRIRSDAVRATFNNERDTLLTINDTIANTLNSRTDLALQVTDEIARITSKERPVERDVCPQAIWYLTEFDGVTLDDTFTRQLEQFNRLRIESGLLPDERRVFGWMLVDNARMLALSGDKNTARHEFGTAITRLDRTVSAFERAGRASDAFDVALGSQAAVVYRGLYTSSDAYGLRRVVDTYLNNIATIFGGADAAEVPPEHASTMQFAIDRASLCLLQAAADPELRHLIVPASPRASHQHDAIAFPLIYSAKASRYDLTSPVTITFVDGAEITAGDKTVQVGRQILTLPDDPKGLHTELRNLISTSTKAAKGAKTVSKPKAKGAKTDTSAPTRSDAVRTLSEKLAYAISDADSWAA